MAFTHERTGFLNHRNSTLYCFLLIFFLFMTSGIIWCSIAAGIALTLTIAINSLFWNRPQPVPDKSAVFITGCSSGIGFSTALEMAQRGFAVFATVRTMQDGQRLTQAHNRIVPVILDVTQPDTIASAVALVEQHLQSHSLTFMALINNAGRAQAGFLEAMDIDTMSMQFHTNVYGQVLVTNAFLPLLRKYSPQALGRSTIKLRPKLIFVGSAMSKFSVAGNGIYAASKHALDAIAKTYRQELKLLGIDVVIVSPGPMRTNASKVATETQIRIDNNGCGALLDKDPRVIEYYSQAQVNSDLQAAELAKTNPEDPIVAAQTMCLAVLSPNPYTRYTVGAFANVLFAIVLPWGWPTVMDYLGSSLFPRFDQLPCGPDSDPGQAAQVQAQAWNPVPTPAIYPGKED